MTPLVVLVSDSHFSTRTPEAERNWVAVVRHVADVGPDLVVHVGDVSVDGARRPEELGAGPAAARPPRRTLGGRAGKPRHRRQSQRRDGDRRGRDERRLAHWRDAVGSDRWVVDLGAWRLVGINAQLFASGGPDEDDQWSFIEQVLGDPQRTRARHPQTAHRGGSGTGGRAAVPLHPGDGVRPLTRLCHDGGVEVVVSGHVHQRRRVEAAAMTHLWATTTWAVLPDWLQAPVGAKRCGILEIGLAAVGHLEFACVEPEGMAQLTLGEDIPSPYEPVAGPAVT
ncbi:MAG TPA: metallophosphoesterase [Acidimicrobiales bacterium]|nr:metallophosphoesterase [Acidimicrobiales bacterium]